MEQQNTEKKLVKRTIPFLPKDQKSFEGIFLGMRVVDQTEQVDMKTGELVPKDRTIALFHKPGDPSPEGKFQTWVNSGLKNALAMAGVIEGEHIVVKHLGKVEMPGKGGATVNQYDIFSYA